MIPARCAALESSDAGIPLSEVTEQRHPPATSKAARPAATERERRGVHDDEPAYVLHSYPFKETSLVVEAFCCNFGRLGLVARGARRPKSSLRGLLMAFQPLSLSWAGRAELRTLHRADWLAGHAQLAGSSLMCGFYLNELLLKLVAREDPHQGLYAAYEEALDGLRAGTTPPGWVLRRFEQKLLRELGYGMLLDHDADGEPIQATASYTYLLEHGPSMLSDASPVPPVELSGKTLLNMAADDYSDPLALQQSRALMRFVLNHYLGGQVLHTRQLLRDMQQI
jgi:DNA repair protein RecO (recombination protein O)